MSSTTTVTEKSSITPSPNRNNAIHPTHTSTEEAEDRSSYNIYENQINGTGFTLSSIFTKLNEIDEFISGPVFRFGLPKWLELLYSFPASIFGSSFVIMTMPLWIALLALLEEQKSQPHDVDNATDNNDDYLLLILKLITICVTTIYITAWGCFQLYGRQDLLMKILYRSSLYQGGTPWSVVILAYTVLNNSNSNSNINNKDIFSMAIYPLFLYPFVMSTVKYLKKTTKRHRPAYKDLNRSSTEKWVGNKKYPMMTEFLAKFNGDASFPSGDAALAALFALPIYYIGSSSSNNNYQHKAIASMIVFLSASGRMYVLAHHFSDVTAGVGTTYLIHYTATSIGFDMYSMEWWYPLLTTFCYHIYDRKMNRKLLAGMYNSNKKE